jgi:tRNA uridine 5-carbamoylmethylation protein Kti12
MNTCLILRGIPTSGKSTFAKEYIDRLWKYDHRKVVVISCDEIRYEMYGKDYKFCQEKEKAVWKKFYNDVFEAAKANQYIIIDNTNIKLSYINRIKEMLVDRYVILIKEFPISTRKAYYRNIMRFIFTGKFIPWNVIRGMQQGYHENREKILEVYGLF